MPEVSLLPCFDAGRSERCSAMRVYPERTLISRHEPGGRHPGLLGFNHDRIRPFGKLGE
jgi:hypothetical protein